MKKRYALPVTAIALTALMAGTAAAAGTTVTDWSQDFEKGPNTFLGTDADWYGTLDKVRSNKNTLPTIDGSKFYAVINGDDSSAPFSRFGGYSDTWDGDWVAELDVYLDPAWETGEAFDYSVAATGTDGNHQRDFIFHVTKDTSEDALLVGGSNNTNFAPKENLENGNHYEVTAAGWYTLQHSFYDDGGVLAVDLNLLDAEGTVVFTETRRASADTIGENGEVGGNRYAWFTFSTVDSLPIDNHEIYNK